MSRNYVFDRQMAYRREDSIVRRWIWAHWLILLVAPMPPAHADIYRYVDEEGAIHFSNVPTSARYEVYIRETPRGRVFYRSDRYDPYIAEAASKYGVPFSLVKAIIKAESDFDPYAVSSSGARGLMQIMPETAKDLGVTDSFNPRENILGGVRYFKELLTRFQGSIPLALAAYNAGPNRVDPLKEVPPIKETEGFVHKVMQYFNGH